MKSRFIRVIFIPMIFASIFTPISAEELWCSTSAGMGVLPGTFSSISLINIDGTIDFGLHKIAGTALRADIELSYAGYLLAQEATSLLSEIHGLQFAILPAYQFLLGDSFILTPQVGIGVQLMFASSVSGGPLSFDTQLLARGGLSLDYRLTENWRVGIEGGYRLLAEIETMHNGAYVTAVLGRKLLDINPNESPEPEDAVVIEKEVVLKEEEQVNPDLLVPLQGLKDVLVYKTADKITIVLLNSFPPDKYDLTGQAGENLTIVGEYMQEIKSKKIAFYGYVAQLKDDASEQNKMLDQDLSLSRAVAVRNWLLYNGYFPEQSEPVTEGRSGNNPIGDNTTPEGRALNRRVEIVIYIAEGGM